MRSEGAAPRTLLMLWLAVVGAVALLVLGLRLAQPDPGLRGLSLAEDGSVVVSLPGVDLPRALQPDPAAPAGLRLLAVLAPPPEPIPALASATALPALLAEGRGLLLEPADLVEDPDMLPGYAAIDRFHARQAVLSRLMREGLIGGGGLVAAVQPLDAPAAGPVHLVALPLAARTAPGALPFGFWLELASGIAVLCVAAFFLALRPGWREGGGMAGFLLAGLGVAGAAFGAAVYSSRPLALDPTLFRALSAANHCFTYLFGLGAIMLFCRYPVPLLRLRSLAPLPLLALAALLAYHLRLAPWEVVTPQNLVGAMFLGILGLVGAQMVATRRRPADRAALWWLGLSVLLGSGLFVGLVALPPLLGQPAKMTQALAFVPLAMIYLGTAFALARWRLFDLEVWAGRVLFRLALVAGLVAIDVALVSLLQLSAPASIASATLLLGLVYFPLRDLVVERYFTPRRPALADLYGQTVSVAFQISEAAKESAWAATLHQVFRPLVSERLDTAPPAARIADEGLALELPALPWSPPLRLALAEGGRRLFTGADLALTRELANLVTTAERDRTAYERALRDERQRIARDLHDDVGSRLLSALHGTDPDRRTAQLIEALSDLRQIAGGLAGREVTLADLLGELRHDAQVRAEAQGARLDWPLGPADDCPTLLPYVVSRNLTAILREGVSNALAHGAPGGPIRITTTLEPDGLRLEMTNPLATRPRPAPAPGRGNGTANLHSRAEAMGATLELGTEPDTDSPHPGRHVLRLHILFALV